VSLLNLAVDSTITRLMKQMERLFVAALTVCWDGDFVTGCPTCGG
jgi:hypothetical protein